jgi:hypothetical protein
VWWARKVFDSQRDLEHKVRSTFPLFLASCAGHLDRDRQGEERCLQGPLSRWNRRPEDGIRYVA